MAILESVNVGRPVPNPYKDTRATGITKLPQTGAVDVRAPGPKSTGLGSGIVGDFVGDRQHHGGDGQAVYAYSREDLDAWQLTLDRDIPCGFFGENLTTRELDVNGARLGERWRIGDEVVLQVTCPRIPCSTFRGQLGERGWLRRFTLAAKPGAYLSVLTPGSIRSGDTIVIVHRPEHDVTVELSFRALMVQHDLLPLLLAAGEDLPEDMRAAALRHDSSQAPLPGT